MNPHVLYLDNDIANLVAFEASLEGILPFRTAAHPAEALRILGEEEVGVLLVREEGTCGPLPEFLEAVRRGHPGTVRLVLTRSGLLDHSDDAAGGSEIVLEQSRSADDLRVALEAALGRHRTLRRLRDLEAKILSAERVYALGVAAAELAHEIRSPLGSISSNLRMASETLARLREDRAAHGPCCGSEADLSAIAGILDDCAAAADSIAEIARGVDLSPHTPDQAESLDLEEVARLTIRALQRDPARREIVAFESGHVPRVRGIRTRLGQVLTNLLTNAIQAACSAPQRPPRVLLRLWHEGDRVFLEVKDNGPGIPEEAFPQIFEPFFTTKTEGGTGLGLPISRRIVEEHGGTIQVRSDRHEGTRFLVSLPAMPGH